MIYVHIGLHKTATTALQNSFFPNLDRIKFLGRVIEGEQHSNRFYKQLCKYCFDENSDLNFEKKLKALLEERIDEFGSILISEEWFTSDYSGFYKFKGATWQVKLAKLARVLNDFDSKVLITIRNPEDVIYSQYLEFKTVGVNSLYTSFEDYLKYSNDSLVYDYPKLQNHLNGLFKKIVFISFDSLIEGRCQQALNNFFNQKVNMNLPRKNSKEIVNNEILLEIENKFTISFLIKKTFIFITPLRLRRYLQRNSLYLLVRNAIVKNSYNIQPVQQLSYKQKILISDKFPMSKKFYEKLDDEFES